MYILAIETTGPFGSVALINEEGKILGHESTKDKMNHLTGLMPMVKDVLFGAGIKGEDLMAVACDIGPGSFTGIRIGVSTCRALAQAWNVKTIPVMSLSSFTAKKELNKSGECRDELKEGDIICAIYNARRRQVYGYIEGLLEEGPWMIDDIINTLKEAAEEGRIATNSRVFFYGDGIDAYKETIDSELENSLISYVYASEENRYQDAKQIAYRALEKARKGETVEYFELLPEYMRQAEAEQKLNAGELPICKGPKQE